MVRAYSKVLRLVQSYPEPHLLGFEKTTYTTGVTPAAVAVDNGSAFAYVANNNEYGIDGSDSVTVLDMRRKLPHAIIHHASFDQPYTISFDDSNRAYVTNSNSPGMAGEVGTITVIDTTHHTVTGVLQCGGLTPGAGGFDGPSGMAILGGVAYVINYGAPGGVSSGNGNTLSVVDIASDTLLQTIVLRTDVPAAPSAVALANNQKFLYISNYVDGNTGTGTVQVLRTLDNVLVATIPGLSGPFAIKVDRTGSRVYVTNFGSNNFAPYGTTVSIIDTNTHTLVKTIQVGIQPSGLAFAPCGHRAYVSNYNTLYATAAPTFADLTPGGGTINIIDTIDERVVSPTINTGQGPAGLDVSPDGTMLMVVNYIANTCEEYALNPCPRCPCTITP